VVAAAVEGDAGIRPGIAAAIRAGADYLERAERVVRAAEPSLPEIDPSLPATPSDPDQLAALAERWGLGSPIARLQDAIEQALTPPVR
jgi:hypothetical protein